MGSKPLFSIITVCYNAANTIHNTIESVLQQTYNDFEYVIIDGNSTDDTVSIINSFSSEKIRLLVEPDKGIYDAMNKAIKLAIGRYIYFLGADDMLYEHTTLANIDKVLNSEKMYDLVYGNVQYNTGIKFESFFGFKTLLNNTIHHQGAFYSSKLFVEFMYDIKYKIVADYELNLLLYKSLKNLSVKKVNSIVSLCSEGGLSRSRLFEVYKETNSIRHKVLGIKHHYLKILYTIKFYLTTYVI